MARGHGEAAAHHAATIATGVTSSDDLVLKECRVPLEARARPTTEADRALAALLGAHTVAILEPAVVHHTSLKFVAHDRGWRCRGDVLHQEPFRCGFGHDPLELRNEVAEGGLIPIGAHHRRQPAE